MPRTRLIVVLLICAAPLVLGAAEPAPATARADVTSLPRIPAELHEALQSRAFDQAVARINKLLAAEKPPHADYLLYLRGMTHLNADQLDPALATFLELEQKHPQSRWLARARFGRAQVLVRQRNYQAASAIYRAEAERLLSTGRRDELTGIYLEFADKYFEGEPEKGPSSQRRPDYNQALAFYQQALQMRPSTAVRHRVELRIARCHQELNQLPQAIAAYQAFLEQYANKPRRPEEMVAPPLEVEARFQLGRAQLAAGQPAEARKTWEDFLAGGAAKEAGGALVAEATYRLAHTHLIPAPPTVGDLELGVGRLERFLKAFPNHELAPQAEFEIAQSYAHHGRFEQTVATLRALIDNPNYAKAKQVSAAWNLLGQAYASQKNYAKAIEAWKAFLERYPSDPNWSNVQRVIIDTEYAVAEELRQKENFDLARAEWETFLNKYPLDPRAPAILLAFGQMRYDAASRLVSPAPKPGQEPAKPDPEGAARLFDLAIEDWQRLVSKYPGTDQSSQAALAIGTTLEDRLGKLAEALEAYKKVEGPMQPQAQQRIANLTARQLEVITERKFRTSEKPRIKVATRNVENVTVKLYRVDLADYFRKMHLAEGVETLDIALIDPDKVWEQKVDGFEKYRRIEQQVEIPVEGPGVTAVTVSTDALEATTMLVISDIDIIVKSSRNELFVFAQNMLQGRPAEGVKLLVSDGSKVFAEAATGQDGILQRKLPELKTVNDLRVFAVAEGHAASSQVNLEGLQFAVGLSAKGYLYTERPAYRSGQIVHVRGIVRWVENDRYTFKPAEKYQLDVYDARGRVVHTAGVELGEFGTLAINFALPHTAPQGQYRVHLHQPGRDQSYETTFLVHEYQLEPIHFSVELAQRVVYRGEHVKGKFVLKYYYGTPLAGRQIQYRLGDDRLHTAETNAKGEVEFDLETQRYSESQTLPLVALYPERNLQAIDRVYLATRGFDVAVSALRSVYVAGETFDATINVSDPAGKPVAVPLTLELFEQIAAARGLPASERLVQTFELKTGEKTGQARHTLRIEKSGRYALRASGTDRFGNRVSGQAVVFVSGDEDQVRLRILADRHNFQVGETAQIQLHWREKPALALLTYEGAEILGYRLVSLQTGSNALALPLEEKLAPNFELAVAVMEGNRFHDARSEFRVTRDLVIQLKPQTSTLDPKDPLTIDIEARDPAGNPVSAELSLAIVQKNLWQMFGDRSPGIDAFFNGGNRQVSMRAMTSCQFRYAPPTRPINLFLLGEEERRKILEAEHAAVEAAQRALGPANAAAGAPLERLAELQDEAAAAAEDAAPQRAVVESGKRRQGIMAGGMGGMPGRPAAPAGPRGGARARSEADRKQLAEKANVLAREKKSASSADGQRLLFDKADAGKADNFSQELDSDGLEALGDLITSTIRPDSWDDANGNTEATLAFRFNSFFGRAARQELAAEADGPRALFKTLESTDGTIMALNRKGEAQVINRLPADALARLAEDGLEIVPGMGRAETAFWSPRIVTDAQGKATLTLRLPDRATAWKLISKGINKQTQAGQAEIEVVTRKELFGELTLPLAFTAGDKAEVKVEIHNQALTEGAIDVRLKTTLGDQSTELKRTLNVKQPGIEELSFPVEIATADQVAFELTVSAGERKDVSSREVPVIPHGLPVYATASGSAAQNTSFQIRPPQGMALENPKLEVIIGASVNRTLLDAVLGGGVTIYERRLINPGNEIERAVSDCVGGVALLKMIGASRTSDTPEAQAIAGKIQSAIAQLVSSQRDDGGWGWAGRPGGPKPDRYITSRALWALAAARRAGFAVQQATFDKAIQHLQSAFAAASESDNEGKVIILHGLAEAGVADFAHANRLHRARQSMSAAGLVQLALVFLRLDKKDFAQELLAIAKEKIPTPPPPAPAADKALAGCIPWMQSGVELRSLYLMALNETQPGAAQNGELAQWLLGARVGARWLPEKANGPAITALADWFGRTRLANEKYTLTIYANDRLVEKVSIDPSVDGSRVISVPQRLLEPGKPQRVNIDIDGRGTFSYSALLSGFVPADKLKTTTDSWHFTRHYEPAQRLLDGETIPRGFDVLTGNYTAFRNPLTQLPLGERGEVTIHVWRARVSGAKDEQLDYLVYTEPIPAGATVLTESIQGSFERYEITPGAITFYLGDHPYPGTIRFAMAGYVAGKFKNVPSLLRSFYQPDQMVVAQDLPLEVLPRGAVSKDEYRLTPQELFEMGRRHFAKREFKKAGEHLAALFKEYRLNDDVYKQTVQMLFEVALAASDHAATVQYFEIIKEKYADAEVSFENILKVALAYIELGEYERGYLVYRATAEASFLRENQIAGFLDDRGQFLRSVQVFERLLLDYPSEAYVATATYALAQELHGKAPEAAANPGLREAGVTRVDLIAAAIHLLDHFLSTWPADPAADQASFALANALLDLQQYQPVIARCTQFAERYPNSKLLDSFWYLIGYSQFALGQHDAALDMCRKVAAFKRKDPQSGVELAALNEKQAIYIMGQVFHSLGKPAEAIAEYGRIKDQFADAAEAIDFFVRKAVSLPEVTSVKPGSPARVPLSFRNVSAATIKVYRIDLLKFSLLQRNLSRITAINLAGIRPYHELALELGDGKDYRDREREMELPLREEGAYLVVCQAENLYASGLVLVSPLSLEVQEDAGSGRVRVTVKDVVADRYAHNIHVKVIGSNNPQFVSGQTDLRGIFVADGINGTSTVIAKTDSNRYAFFRGKLPLGAPPAQTAAPLPANQPPSPKDAPDSLLKNVIEMNSTWQMEQRGNYRNLLRNRDSGVKAQSVK